MISTWISSTIVDFLDQIYIIGKIQIEINEYIKKSQFCHRVKDLIRNKDIYDKCKLVIFKMNMRI